MILEVFRWVAIADAIAGALLGLATYLTGRRSGHRVSRGQAVAIAILFGLPATLLFVIVWCVVRLGSSG
jgi:hypothetical protein